VSVVSCFAVDGAQQVKLLDDLGRFEIEDFADCALQLLIIYFAGTKGIDADANGFWMTNGIGELDFATIR
jgi:hypothetical protein